jgi:hypothetical protein
MIPRWSRYDGCDGGGKRFSGNWPAESYKGAASSDDPTRYSHFVLHKTALQSE